MVGAEIRNGLAETSMRPLWHAIAALAAILPAAGTALAVRGVISTFEGIAATGSGGVGTAAIGLYEANRFLIVAAVAAAVLAGWLTVTVRRKPQAFPGLLLSLVPVLACLPTFLLWLVESFILDVLAGRIPASDRVSQGIGRLLTMSFGSATVVIFLAVAGFAISLARPRSTGSALSPAAVWASMTVLLLALAAGFYMRSAYFYEVALTGQL
jgi:hypothetical protein